MTTNNARPPSEPPAKTLTLDEFEPVTYEQWRSVVERDLKGAPFEKRLHTHTYEGIDVLPLYTGKQWPSAGDPSGLPGFKPYTRGRTPLDGVLTGWEVRQEFAEADVNRLNQAVLTDLRGGVSGVHLRLDVAARNATPLDEAGDNTGRDGAMLYALEDFERALEGVHLEMITLSLEAGAAAPAAGAIVAGLYERRGHAQAALHAHFNADPLAVLARDGAVPGGLDRAFEMTGELAVWCKKHAPKSRAVRVGTAPYHHAGATSAQDLGFSMATAVAYLRVLTAAGLTVDEAAQQLVFNFGVGCNFFLAGAKLRAARRLWDRVLEASGSTQRESRMLMHVKPSKRVLTRRDPWVNMLRNTVCTFAASVGGADIVTSVPMDAAIGEPNDFTRRISRNTQLILKEESQLHRVVDPAGGSWFIESLTDALAQRGWETFQEIERRGGMGEAIKSGWVHEQIDSVFRARLQNVATRREAITGVTEFASVAEQPVVRAEPNRAELRRSAESRLAGRRTAPDLEELLGKVRSARHGAVLNAAIRAAEAGATIDQLHAATAGSSSDEEIAPIAPHPYAAPFEALRDASDVALEGTGTRPRVFLANIGKPAQHIARSTFSRNFFEAGGFEVISSKPLEDGIAATDAFLESGASIAVLCSSDDIYEETAWEIAPKLRAAGARTVILAGHPGSHEAAYREAGVGRFIFIKCDVLQTLTELLEEEGVLA